MVLGLLIVYGLFCWLKFVEIYTILKVPTPHLRAQHTQEPSLRVREIIPFSRPLNYTAFDAHLEDKGGGGQ